MMLMPKHIACAFVLSESSETLFIRIEDGSCGVDSSIRSKLPKHSERYSRDFHTAPTILFWFAG